MIQQYREINFREDTLAMIEACNAIIADMAQQGFNMNLRQLYYQLVQANVIANSIREYKRLSRIITEARYAGLVDWNDVVDQTRYVRQLQSWSSPADVVAATSGSFRLDKWSKEFGQDQRPLVMIEKDALVGVFLHTCERLDVPLLSCRGYTSASEMYNVAQRLVRVVDDGQTPVVFHFGDHDPSGQDMSRDILDRIEEFMRAEVGMGLEFNRVALNMKQVDIFKLPPQPAKEKDSRYKTYVAKYGKKSWELDALNAATLGKLIEKSVKSVRNEEAWTEACEEEARQRIVLDNLVKHWTGVDQALAKPPKRGAWKLVWKRAPKPKKKAKRAKKSRKAATKRKAMAKARKVK